MKKLDAYILRKFLGTFALALAMILCIVVIFDISERLEKFLANEAPLKEIIFDYYLNFIPYFANLFASLFTFIAVIFFTSKMAYNSEIIAILSTGTSFRRLLRPYLIGSGLIAVLSFVLAAYIIPNANEGRIIFSQKYLWKKYYNREQNIHRQIAPDTYIYMSSYSVTANIGYDFTIEQFRGDTLIKKLNSRMVEWKKEEEKWRIKDWTLRELNGTLETYTTGKELDTVMSFLPKEFSEDPAKIKEKLTLRELNEYIEREQMRGNSNVMEFQLEKYQMFSNAYATIILTIIGACIASRKIRGGMGLHLGIGLVLAFGYILFQQFTKAFAASDAVSPLLAVWIPNIIFTVIAAGAYLTAPK